MVVRTEDGDNEDVCKLVGDIIVTSLIGLIDCLSEDESVNAKPVECPLKLLDDGSVSMVAIVNVVAKLVVVIRSKKDGIWVGWIGEGMAAFLTSKNTLVHGPV